MTQILTAGHSTRPLDELVAMLRSFGVTLLADVRTLPRSRRNPHFNAERLPPALGPHGIGYLHLPGLGGLRKPRPDSPNTGLRHEGFRGFADYMQTEAFEAALAELISLAGSQRVAVMCAEADPSKCHRSLLSDALVVRGVRVDHATAPATSHPHELSRLAVVEGTKLAYPSDTLF